jgi:hypothetical protein
MARAAIVLGVLISSPSDVLAETATIRTAINDWNSSHSRDLGIFLEPIHWQTHAYPESGDRPQAILNKQLVDDSDMVVAAFGCRIGTATDSAESGTAEEIERLRGKGKHVAVYFSSAPIPRDHDPNQLRRLNEYRESLKPNTLYWTFDSPEELYRLVSQHLAKSVSRLYQDLRGSGTIRVLASQLPGVVGGPELSTPFTAENKSVPGAPLYLEHTFIGEFPDHHALRLNGNRPLDLKQIEYLDENGVRVAAERQSIQGQILEVPIDQRKLVQIHNLRPRTGGSIPMQFRLHFVVDGRDETRTIPVLIEPSFKLINNVTTYFMKIVG